MPKQSLPIPLIGRGEQSAAAPGSFGPGEAALLENAVLSGPGQVSQVPDWRLSYQGTNDIGTPPATTGGKAQAVCGIFPFAQPCAGTPGGGILFTFHRGDQRIYLEHVGEAGQLLRRLAAWPWTLTNPPQITGFEWFGTFVAVPYGREAAAARQGLGIYDPVAGTFTVPAIEIITGGAGAAAMRFRGISKHRTMVLAWGYRSENTGHVDAPDFLRWTSPAGVSADLSLTATWQSGGTDDFSPGGAIIGTPGQPIVACGQSGLVSVVAKETEVFALEGETGGELYLGRRLGDHGPKSTVSLVSYRDGAAWMHERVGPVVSVNGGPLQILGTNRLLRRLLTYIDYGNAVGAHIASQTLVVWGLRRQRTLLGDPITAYWPDELFCWDYQKDELFVRRPPGPFFAVGTLNGKGEVLVGPTGAPSGLAITDVLASGATATWVNGDTSVDVQTVLEYRRTIDATWTSISGIGSGQGSYGIASLQADTDYEARLKHVKNGQESAYSSTVGFHTATAPTVGAPVSLVAEPGGGRVDTKGIQYYTAMLTLGRGDIRGQSEFWESTSPSFSGASLIATVDIETVTHAVERTQGSVRYFWVRHRKGTAVSAETPLAPNPLTFTSALEAV